MKLGRPPCLWGIVARMPLVPRELRTEWSHSFIIHTPAGAEVAVDVISEHKGSTQLGTQTLINTRVTGIPTERLPALFRAVVCTAKAACHAVAQRTSSDLPISPLLAVAASTGLARFGQVRPRPPGGRGVLQPRCICAGWHIWVRQK